MQKNAGADPATNHYTISPSDTSPLSPVPRAIYVNTSGNLVIGDTTNTVITYSVTAGQVFPFRANLVTTATTANVVAWY